MTSETVEFTRYRHIPEDSTSLSYVFVTDLFEDRSGVFQVGTQGGLNMHKPGKIKTIGDAYMAAGGIPKAIEYYAPYTVQAACEMLNYIRESNKKSTVKWQMRVGKHSGSVIAGVVGGKKICL